MQTYRVAMLGCGPRGGMTAGAYRAHPRTELVALCDLDRGRVDKLGDTLGVSARYVDLDRMIAQERPDIVAIPTATQTHYELAMRVLEHSVHVDVEKPLGVDLEQADAVLDKAASQGVRVAVHQQHRSGAAMRAITLAVAQGRIGELRHMSATGKGYYGGFELMNIGTHTINLMLALTPRCRHVTAVATAAGRPITPQDVRWAPQGMGAIAGEHITAALHFDHPVSALLTQQHRLRTDVGRRWLVLHGTEGCLAWHCCRAWWVGHPAEDAAPGSCAWEALEPIHPAGYGPDAGVSADDYAFADEFVHALDEGRDHESGGGNARHVMEIMMAVFESAAYARRVDLPQARRDHPLLRWRRSHALADPPPMPTPYAEWIAAVGADR